MLTDKQYQKHHFCLSEAKHQYGENIHIIEDPYLFTLLARLCHPSCRQPQVSHLIRQLYSNLLSYAVNREFPLTEKTLETRMKSYHPEGEFTAQIINPETRAILVNLARAGTLPSQVCFDQLNYLLNPEQVRQDHISINRKTNSDEQVIGANLGGIKIGGDVDKATVFFPDPMAATGSTMKTVLDIYKHKAKGTVKKFIALHLIVTPEYLANLKDFTPELSIYTLRLDRGLSSQEVLQTTPGTKWAEERGLNAKHYIVPGAGGVGEIINNASV